MICVPTTTAWEGCGFSKEEIEALDPDLKTSSEALAWYALAVMSAFRIGVCETTVRPCAAGCGSGGSYLAAPVLSAESSALPAMTIGGIFTPYVNGQGIWVNGCGCSSGDDCGCGRLSRAILPGPVGSISEVRVGGEVVPPSEYRVDNGNELVALGDRTWPLCQDMSTDGISDGFSVTYYRGAPPNEMLNRAAGVLATEFYKSCTGKKCRLPRNARTVSRNGVEIEIEADTFAAMKLIPEVAIVIGLYNPHALKTAPRVRTPDQRRARQTTGIYG